MSIESNWIVNGMHCGGCAKKVRGQLEQNVAGFVEAEIDPKSGSVRLVTEAAPDENNLRQAVTAAGFTFVGAKS